MRCKINEIQSKKISRLDSDFGRHDQRFKCKNSVKYAILDIMIFIKKDVKLYGAGFILYKYFPVMFCFRDIN